MLFYITISKSNTKIRKNAKLFNFCRFLQISYPFFFLQAEQSLPKEPAETESNISKIRVRKPSGDFLERRFYANNTLQVRPKINLFNPNCSYYINKSFFLGPIKLCSFKWFPNR